MKEFIEKAKASGGKMNWTSSGAGTTPQLAGELIKLRTGIQMQHIPFAGAGPPPPRRWPARSISTPPISARCRRLIDAGKLRADRGDLEEALAGAADVPTLEEAGIKDAESDTFQGIYVRAGTPQPIIDRLAKELTAILNRPDIKEKFDKIGLPVVAEGPAAFRERVEREVPMYKEIIDKAGLKVQ